MNTMFKLIGTKSNMTQIWKGDIMVPVTVLKMEEGSDLSVLVENALVNVAGITKGHGFAGVVKRHDFHGGPKTHGQKNRFRAPGSIGNTAAQRVIPGLRMAGHMGVIRVTIKNLKVIEVKPESREVFLRGAVPGPKKGRIEISA
ncbi:MAG: 50S ribosomal protein L3 [bacterium]|nr:50S ribosomal protein L3 [bacterium]